MRGQPLRAAAGQPLAAAAVAIAPAAHKKGSSPNSGEGSADLQEEVVVVAEAIGHALDDLDLVVDALDEVGAQREAAVRQDAGQVGLEIDGESLERLDATASGLGVPAAPSSCGVAVGRQSNCSDTLALTEGRWLDRDTKSFRCMHQFLRLAYRRVEFTVRAEPPAYTLGATARRSSTRSRPMVDALHQWLIQQRHKVRDGSATARAIDYSLNRWQALTQSPRKALAWRPARLSAKPLGTGARLSV